MKNDLNKEIILGQLEKVTGGAFLSPEEDLGVVLPLEIEEPQDEPEPTSTPVPNPTPYPVRSGHRLVRRGVICLDRRRIPH